MIEATKSFFSSSWESTKDAVTGRTAQKCASEILFWGSAAIGVGGGLAASESVTGVDAGAENMVTGQLNNAFDALGASDAVRQLTMFGASTAVGVGTGRYLRRKIKPEEIVSVDLPYQKEEVPVSEAQSMIKGAEKRVVDALSTQADELGVDQGAIEDARGGDNPLVTLREEIIASVERKREALKTAPEIWELRTRTLPKELSLEILSTVAETGEGDEKGSLVRAMTAEETRDEVIAMKEQIIVEKNRDEEEDEEEKEKEKAEA